MTLLEAIEVRHSVRRYKDIPLSDDIVKMLQDKINELNVKTRLLVQLITNEPKAFKGIFTYSKFSGASNYFVMTGKKSRGIDERVSYYGEQLVLLAQQLELNTCLAGLSYQKVANTYVLNKGEKIACDIALGYGETQGAAYKSKDIREISNASDSPLSGSIELLKRSVLLLLQ
jgi:nitroreductase